jgi:hypothetical protein
VGRLEIRPRDVVASLRLSASTASKLGAATSGQASILATLRPSLPARGRGSTSFPLALPASTSGGVRPPHKRDLPFPSRTSTSGKVRMGAERRIKLPSQRRIEPLLQRVSCAAFRPGRAAGPAGPSDRWASGRVPQQFGCRNRSRAASGHVLHRVTCCNRSRAATGHVPQQVTCRNRSRAATGHVGVGRAKPGRTG